MDLTLLKVADDIAKIIDGQNPNIFLQLTELRDKYITEFEKQELDYLNQQEYENGNVRAI